MIHIKDVTKSFGIGTETEIQVIKGVSFDIEKGEYVILSGSSGAGKSTLMYQLALLSTPTSGEITINDNDVLTLSEKERSLFRLNTFGFIFQSYALNKDLNAVENVALPMMAQGVSKKEAHKRSEEVLIRLGLSDQFNNYPEELSGGEQQRVSIARAIAKKPEVIFADEPTASLDVKNSDQVMDILDELHAEGITIVAITHEEQYEDRGGRLIELSDGLVIEDKPIIK